MEPAVGLGCWGCILRSVRRGWEEEDDKKNKKHYIRASKSHPELLNVSQQDTMPLARPKKRRKNIAVMFLPLKRPQSPAG